jgi:hypothetical protein
VLDELADGDEPPDDELLALDEDPPQAAIAAAAATAAAVRASVWLRRRSEYLFIPGFPRVFRWGMGPLQAR